MIVKLTSPPI